MADFKKKVYAHAENEFSSREDIADVLAEVKGQRVPGELIVSLPGNGGVSGIIFREKKQQVDLIEEE